MHTNQVVIKPCLTGLYHEFTPKIRYPETMSSFAENQKAATDTHLTKEEFDRLPEIAKNAITASGIPLSITATVEDGSRRTSSVQTVDVDKESLKSLAGILGAFRWDWGILGNGDWILSLNWSIITATSIVLVSVSEGVLGTCKITLFNVAPRNGGVDIWINISCPTGARIYESIVVIG